METTLGIAQIIGLVIVVALTIFGGIMIVLKSKKNNLIKWIGLFVLLALGLTWVFGYGYYNGSTYQSGGMSQQGISDLANYVYYTFNFAADKIVFLLVLGAFYAVLLRSKGYKKLVNTLSENLKGKELIFVLICSLFITVMTSVYIQSFIPLIFVPFIISVLLSLKLDKLTAFSATFGSMMIGLLGQTYGGEGISVFDYYTGIDLKAGLLYRLIVLVVGFILFNFFTILHAKKVLKEKDEKAEVKDPFKVEKLSGAEEKAHAWPIVLLFVLIFVITVLGYVDWNTNFGITFFRDIHDKILSFALKDIPLIGKLFSEKLGAMTPVSAIMGTLFKTGYSVSGYFGAWNLMHGSMLLIIATIIIAIANKIKFNDFISSYAEGTKKIIVPVAALMGAYLIMSAAYVTPFVTTITNTIFNGVTKFNPYLVSLGAFITNAFHPDFGFSGYLVGSFYAATFASNIDLVHTIFITMYGFVSLFVPSSALLLVGLTYLDIDYKDWIKYIWLFLLGILVILIVLFTVVTYI